MWGKLKKKSIIGKAQQSQEKSAQNMKNKLTQICLNYWMVDIKR